MRVGVAFGLEMEDRASLVGLEGGREGTEGRCVLGQVAVQQGRERSTGPSLQATLGTL